MSRLWIAAVTVLCCRGAIAADPPVALKPGPGRETTAAACSACHTTDYIVMNSMFLTADAWKTEVRNMRSAFGARISDESAAAITAYLGTNYAAVPKP